MQTPPRKTPESELINSSFYTSFLGAVVAVSPSSDVMMESQVQQVRRAIEAENVLWWCYHFTNIYSWLSFISGFY